MEKSFREISHFFVAPRCEFAPAVSASPPTPFSINASTSVYRDNPAYRRAEYFGIRARLPDYVSDTAHRLR